MSTPPSRLVAALADRYRIDRELGQGGMATVYVARDVRHDRDVAIKVLHPELAAAVGADRFLAEIKTTARLQHPHILPLLDSGAADGLLFYVMPYVAGESLRDRLARERQLPLDDVLRIAREVADALGAAHAIGIVHRDIKPENILLQGGHALVADFGIALAVQQAGGQRMTQTGLSLGTPQYMSPEQATGERTIDHRSDLYSLGAVTYEMLVGEPPFTGPTVQAIVARTLTERPTPPRRIRDSVPPNVEAAVLQALAKLPADRFASAAALATALDRPTVTTAPSLAHGRGRLRRLAPWVLLAVLVPIVLPRALHTERGRDTTILRATLPLDLREIAPSSLVISPDARYVAYVGSTRTRGAVHLVSLASGQQRRIDGAGEAQAPFFSPDGNWVAFFNGDRLLRAPVDGGRTEDLGEIPPNAFRTGTWTSRDEIIVGGDRLRRIAANGGPPARVGSDSAARRCIWPLATPDGRHVVCNVGGPAGSEDDILHVVDLTTGATESTGLDAREPVAFRLGHLIYRRGAGVVMAVPFDPGRARVSGEPFQVGGRTRSVSLANNGTALFAEEDLLHRLVLRAGDSSRTLWSPPWPVASLDLSPNGSAVALWRRDANEVWLYDIATTTSTRLAPSGVEPAWSPDGQYVGYIIPAVGMQPRREARRRRADLGALEETIFRTDSVGIAGVQFLGDGTTLALGIYRPTRAVWTVTLGSNVPVALSASDEEASQPRFSPDGRWIAYVVTEGGGGRVVVRPANGGGRVTISDGVGTEPVWGRRSRALFYRRDDEFVRADLAFDPAPRVIRRTVVLRGTFLRGAATSYDVAADGQRLLVAEPVSGGRVAIVVNWVEELRAKLGLVP